MSKLRQMEVFVAVVEAGSFADAATQVGMSAVMVGRHIQSLEKTLNTKLIQRTTRRQSITGEGRLFYQEAKLALEQVSYAFNRVEAVSAEPSGLLRITAPVSLGVSLVGPLVADFMGEYPDVQVELILSNEVVDLYESAFDLGFRISELIGVNLVSRALPPYRMVICAAPRYLAQRPEPTTPEALHQHRLLSHTSWNNRFAWPLKNGSSDVPWPERAVLKSNDGQILLQAAIAGEGILMQPDFLVSAALASGELVRIMDAYAPPPKPVQMVYPRAKKSLPKLNAFVEFVARRMAAGG
ncbi:LysR family transcriptional regulator [Pseudomonas sp. SZMC_28357]|uniref:LysR family transcriptional regulator n=1 Tax=Pseudomonas sp. SZMC_28357 TaxID=3074380 RepID=UPI002872A8C7|nr:LysR family transcriptional regulator [Pseudomonas sp. SZMC_28357]MDR9754040.1 LysR family transcriptional regulator [Pseudomonas sp. SZMC_28357]